jgi:hypothetical protein
MDQNECYHLEIKHEDAPMFDELVNMQKELQLRIMPNFCDENRSIAEIAEFFMKNKHALEEELAETLNALGGTHDPLQTELGKANPPLGSAAWKWWKNSNKFLAETHTIEDLSGRDMLELKMEIVDQFHFFMNQMVAINMTGSELYSMYKSKNAENFRRQRNGY